MEVHLQIRRSKSTIFLSMEESSKVHEVKKKLEGVTKIPVSIINLLELRSSPPTILADPAVLAEYGLTAERCTATHPAELVMQVGQEPVLVAPYSKPSSNPLSLMMVEQDVNIEGNL